MKKTVALTAALAACVVGSIAYAGGSIDVDLSGMNSWGFQGDGQNETIDLAMNVGDTIHSMDYDVILTSVGVSWGQEATYSLYDGGNLVVDGSGGAWNFAPGVDFEVDHWNAVGSHDWADFVMTSNTLTIELHEWDFDDNPGAIDTIYEDGSGVSINFTAVPAPSVLSVMALGLVGFGRRRRR